MSKHFCRLRINFVNKEDPSYKPTYGKILTEKQMLILNGTIPLEEVRPNEVTILLRKAEVIGDEKIMEEAQMYMNGNTTPKNTGLHIPSKRPWRFFKVLPLGQQTINDKKRNEILQ